MSEAGSMASMWANAPGPIASPTAGQSAPSLRNHQTSSDGARSYNPIRRRGRGGVPMKKIDQSTETHPISGTTKDLSSSNPPIKFVTRPVNEPALSPVLSKRPSSPRKPPKTNNDTIVNEPPVHSDVTATRKATRKRGKASSSQKKLSLDTEAQNDLMTISDPSSPSKQANGPYLDSPKSELPAASPSVTVTQASIQDLSSSKAPIPISSSLTTTSSLHLTTATATMTADTATAPPRTITPASQIDWADEDDSELPDLGDWAVAPKPRRRSSAKTAPASPRPADELAISNARGSLVSMLPKESNAANDVEKVDGAASVPNKAILARKRTKVTIPKSVITSLIAPLNVTNESASLPAITTSQVTPSPSTATTSSPEIAVSSSLDLSHSHPFNHSGSAYPGAEIQDPATAPAEKKRVKAEKLREKRAAAKEAKKLAVQVARVSSSESASILSTSAHAHKPVSQGDGLDLAPQLGGLHLDDSKTASSTSSSRKVAHASRTSKAKSMSVSSGYGSKTPLPAPAKTDLPTTPRVSASPSAPAHGKSSGISAIPSKPSAPLPTSAPASSSTFAPRDPKHPSPLASPSQPLPPRDHSSSSTNTSGNGGRWGQSPTPSSPSLFGPSNRPSRGARGGGGGGRGGVYPLISHHHSASRPVISPGALNQLTKSLSGGSRAHRAETGVAVD